MRYAVIMIPLLLLSSGPAHAEWVLIDKTDDGMSTYVDTATIRRKGELVKMWIMYDFKNVQTDAFAFGPYLSLKGQSEFDCIEERGRSIAQTLFSGNTGKGEVIFTDVTKQAWRPAAPESIGRMLWKVACGKQ